MNLNKRPHVDDIVDDYLINDTYMQQTNASTTMVMTPKGMMPSSLSVVTNEKRLSDAEATLRRAEMRRLDPLITPPAQGQEMINRFAFTNKQMDYIRKNIAKNATDEELELFFYRCVQLELNPLMPGQIYFIKFGNNAGTIILGIDGLRAHAYKTGKLSGINRGLIRSDIDLKLTGAWAEIKRTDWEKPVREEVSLAEYVDPRKPNWRTMPETMIKKVAEAAALRIAFPQDLGGLYINEEMNQAE